MSNNSSRLGLALTTVGAFLAFLDATIVNIAFPDIARSFPDAELDDLSWVLNAYNIVFAALLIPAGRLADVVGAKRLFVIGVATFTFASLLCAGAPTLEALVAARTLQAVGAAALVPTSLALLLHEFGPKGRGSAIATWTAVAALSGGLGPTLGGLLIDVADWRWVFLVNLPIGAVAAVGVARLVAARNPSRGRLPDPLGTVLAVLGVGALALGIVRSESWGWASPRTAVLLTLGASALWLLVRRSRRHAQPLLPVGLFRDRAFALGNLATLTFGMAYFAAILTNVLFLTGGWGYSVLRAGLALSLPPVLVAVSARPASRLAQRRGQHVVVVPAALLYASGLLVLLLNADDPPAFWTVWVPSAVLIGVGAGATFATLGAASMSTTSDADLGAAAAINAAGRQLGAVLGIALLVVVVGGTEVALGPDDLQRAWLFATGMAVTTAVVAAVLGSGRPAEDVLPTDSPAVLR